MPPNSHDEPVFGSQSLQGHRNVGFIVLDVVTFVQDRVAPHKGATEPRHLWFEDLVNGQ